MKSTCEVRQGYFLNMILINVGFELIIINVNEYMVTIYAKTE